MISISLFILGIGFIIQKYDEKMEEKYKIEISHMTSEDLKTINKVISLAKEKEGQEYTWGGKGEIITEERLNELISDYGESYYPLDRSAYIGKQGFDCSGLVYWAYKTVTGVNIGYSTIEQQDILKNYKINMKDIQPGDLIFTTRHVVMYIGKNKVINSSGRRAYPMGGVKIQWIYYYKSGQAYRPIDYINTFK